MPIATAAADRIAEIEYVLEEIMGCFAAWGSRLGNGRREWGAYPSIFSYRLEGRAP